MQAVHLTLVYGRSDEYITAKIVQTTTARLRQHGIPYREVPFEGGHELNEAVLRGLDG